MLVLKQELDEREVAVVRKSGYSNLLMQVTELHEADR